MRQSTGCIALLLPEVLMVFTRVRTMAARSSLFL